MSYRLRVALFAIGIIGTLVMVVIGSFNVLMVVILVSIFGIPGFAFLADMRRERKSNV